MCFSFAVVTFKLPELVPLHPMFNGHSAPLFYMHLVARIPLRRIYFRMVSKLLSDIVLSPRLSMTLPWASWMSIQSRSLGNGIVPHNFCLSVDRTVALPTVSVAAIGHIFGLAGKEEDRGVPWGMISLPTLIGSGATGHASSLMIKLISFSPWAARQQGAIILRLRQRTLQLHITFFLAIGESTISDYLRFYELFTNFMKIKQAQTVRKRAPQLVDPTPSTPATVSIPSYQLNHQTTMHVEESLNTQARLASVTGLIYSGYERQSNITFPPLIRFTLEILGKPGTYRVSSLEMLALPYRGESLLTAPMASGHVETIPTASASFEQTRQTLISFTVELCPRANQDVAAKFSVPTPTYRTNSIRQPLCHGASLYAWKTGNKPLYTYQSYLMSYFTASFTALRFFKAGFSDTKTTSVGGLIYKRVRMAPETCVLALPPSSHFSNPYLWVSNSRPNLGLIKFQEHPAKNYLSIEARSVSYYLISNQNMALEQPMLHLHSIHRSLPTFPDIHSKRVKLNAIARPTTLSSSLALSNLPLKLYWSHRGGLGGAELGSSAVLALDTLENLVIFYYPNFVNYIV
ncbi:uncharacterized protein BDR25DRAFT_390210 [Lindgomyces ingoldianus]|uniref:Uncharacterized protein n=1 Tax=Lindgomyces ingoldianus TaxID=673940 RepID=A0ACB6REI7_9PLEO|nr:uncharacterized protein BDR25DRAFT_390210 [Lindgomyces ingoldianus]KAF2477723.1 hypothetical protein BDR25DRAFT_390210 [Lindgomyces ingoldianus]